ncbi:MAG TPA: hypothetical protein VET46_10315 [Steroidobacteraceae bacterium]|nr:hypothetical protein [Steroidobacteraceae bacterium]
MRAFALLLSLAMIAVQGGAVATVPEPADEAGVALASVPGGAQARHSAPGPLPALNPWRYFAANSLRPERGVVDNMPQIATKLQGGRTPGSWALLLAGLAGALAIGRRRLSSIADPGIARRRRWRA